MGAAATGAALGAYLSDDEDELTGALTGGLMGAAAALLVWKRKSLDQAFGMPITRLKNIYQPIARRVNDMENFSNTSIGDASGKIVGFVKSAKGLTKDAYQQLDAAWMDQDVGRVEQLVKGNAQLAKDYAAVREFLGDTGATLIQLGRFKRGIAGYLPRVVKDYPGLMKSLGREARTSLESIILKAEGESVRLRQRMMTDVEKSLIIDRFLQSTPGMSSLPGFARDRSVKMTAELRRFYHTLEDGLVHYAHAAASDIALARFFGQDHRTKTEGGKTYTQIEDSIGAVIGRGIDEGHLTPEQAVEVGDIIRARLGPGAKAPAPALQVLRNVTAMLMLGQITSGIIQLSESLMSAAHHGILPAVRSAGIIATGRGIKPAEFGLATHVIEEVIGKTLTGKALSMQLKANLLAPLDQLSIKQNLTASYLKNKKLSGTPAGRAVLEADWGTYYGKDFPALVRQLQESTLQKRRPLVESLLYAELEGVRMTARSSTPQLAMEHPNGRFMYQLSGYMLLQGNIIRTKALEKIATGKPKEIAKGLEFLVKYATILSLSLVPLQAIKEWISGRDFEWDDVDLVHNFFQNFGWSRYNSDKVTFSTNPALAVGENVADYALPPSVGAAKILAEATQKPEKLIAHLPVLGRALYDREFGGNEEKEISKARRLNRDRRKELGLASGRPLSSGDKTRLSDEAEKFRKDRLQKRIDKREREAGR